MNNPLVHISFGEYADKITILRIKQQRIQDNNKIKNVKKELDMLVDLDDHFIIGSEQYNKLYKVNSSLWDVEDNIRIHEKNGDFGHEFVQLAREVYRLNDDRARIKNKINLDYGSDLVEEKSYTEYTSS